MAVKLTIAVPDITTVLQSFNAIRIKRSTTGESGAYDFITANVPAKATLLSPNAGPYVNLVGKTLTLIRDQQPQFSVTFTGVGNLTSAQVASQINTAAGVTIAFDEGGKVRLTSTITGTASRIEIVSGSAVATLGWDPGDRDIGEDSHITLQTAVTSYEYIDNDGQAGYFYKAQFYNTSVNLASGDSQPFEGDAGPKLDADELCLVKLDLVDAQGVAIPNQEVTFYPTHELDMVVDGFQIALNRAPITIKTDNEGHAEISLVRGLKVKVVFDGTSIIRTITIPDAVSVDLWALMSEAPDPFNITTLPFPAAPRRTL